MRYNEIISEDGQASFARWFAGSKVVDEQGRPKRMYHGTGAGDIQAFDPARIDPKGLYGPGFYFTDSPKVAGHISPEVAANAAQDTVTHLHMAQGGPKGYAFSRGWDVQPYTPEELDQLAVLLRRDDLTLNLGEFALQEIDELIGEQDGLAAAQWVVGLSKGRSQDARKFAQLCPPVRMMNTRTPTVYPVYLSIKNPFEMEALAPRELYEAMLAAAPDYGNRQPVDVMVDMAWTPKRTFEDAWKWLWSELLGGDAAKAKAKANRLLMTLGYDGILHEGGNVVGGMGFHDVWIAFSPSQIKSVFARRFDPNAPEISETALD